uniref:Uncharacterized protein n=1 Tax=Brassica oleracea TaxID=3712 RepID=A0A3P6FSH7_BRAOL|nr:unnamed protein product [Brassica oleracea]
MAAFSVNGQLIPGTTSSTSICTRRKLLSLPSSRLPRISSPSPRVPSIKCSSSRDTEAPPKDLLLKNLAKSLAEEEAMEISAGEAAVETEMTVDFWENCYLQRLLLPMRNSHRIGILTAYRRTS